MSTDLNQTGQARGAATKTYTAAQATTRAAKAELLSALAAKGITDLVPNTHRFRPGPTPSTAAVTPATSDFNALVASVATSIAAEASAKAVWDAAVKADNDARAAVGVT